MIRMFQCVGFQLFCLGAVFEKYFQTRISLFSQNPDLQKKLQSLQAHITSLSEQQVSLARKRVYLGAKKHNPG